MFFTDRFGLFDNALLFTILYCDVTAMRLIISQPAAICILLLAVTRRTEAGRLYLQALHLPSTLAGSSARDGVVLFLFT